MSRTNATIDGRRVCVACGANLPIDRFYRSGRHTNGRRRTCAECMRRADDARRRAEGRPVRKPRRNSRGELRCSRCERYYPPERFFPRSDRPGNYHTYCKDCMRAYDRERREQLLLRDPDAALAAQDARNERRNRARTRELRQRQAFVVHALSVLRRRGFTRTDISAITGCSHASQLAWERGTRQVTANVEARLAIALRETAHLPTAHTPKTGGREHPERERIAARCAPEIRPLKARARGNHRKGGRR